MGDRVYEAVIETGLKESRALPSYDISIEGEGSGWAVNRFDKSLGFSVGDRVLVVKGEFTEGYVIIDIV